MSAISKVYRNLIMKNNETHKTIEDVPEKYKKEVLELLKIEGLDGWGQPL